MGEGTTIRLLLHPTFAVNVIRKINNLLESSTPSRINA